MRFSNLRIGVRLGIGFVSVLVVFSIVAVLQIKAMMDMGDIQAEGARRASHAFFVGEIDSRLESLYGIAADAVINGNLEESAKELAKAKKQFSQDTAELGDLVDTPGERAMLADFEKAMTAYFSIIEGVV